LRVFLLIFLVFTNLLSAKVLEIGSKPLYNTKNHIVYTLVEKCKENPTDLLNRKWNQKKKSLKKIENFDKAYWEKLQIKNSSSKEQTYYLKSENQFTYHIEFFLLKKGTISKYIEDGVIAKNQDRKFNTNHMIFPITLEVNETVEVFFKIRNYNKINIDFTLVTEEYLLDYYQTYNIVEGIFFGGMLLMMLYNFFLYFLLHFRAYLYYVLYTFWLIVYFTGLFGFSQRYFAHYTWIFYISSGAFFIFLTLFVQSILNMKEQLPKINKIMNIFITYFIIATLINIYVLEIQNFFYAQILFNLFFILVPIYVTLIIFSTYYLAYYKNNLIAKIYSLVWTLVSLVGFILPLVYLNIIKTDIPSDYIFQFLILFEVLCFSFILAYKIKLIENEKKEQEKILIQQNKLASMGEMISAIAHQWRQPLSEINGVILTMDVDYNNNKLSSETFNKYLDNLERTTAYMSNTIHDFMDFFKHNKQLEEVRVSEVIENAIKLSSLSEKKIHIHYKKREHKILTFKSELTQALLIVLNNAIDACHNNSNRIPIITIEERLNNKNFTIAIKDNGLGINPNIINKIFTPYFTTKHESEGTGLGLYILKMIIEQNMQGKITLHSSQFGTNCELLIPLKCD